MEIRFKFDRATQTAYVGVQFVGGKPVDCMEVPYISMVRSAIEFPPNYLSMEVVASFQPKMKRKIVKPENPDPKGDPYGVLVKSIVAEVVEMAVDSVFVVEDTIVLNTEYKDPTPRKGMFDTSNEYREAGQTTYSGPFSRD